MISTYFEDKEFKLYLGDCLEILPELPRAEARGVLLGCVA